MVSTRAYSVEIGEKAAEASASCIVFVSPLAPDVRRAELRLIRSSFNDSGLAVRPGRQATFQEWFRVCGEAFDGFSGEEAEDEANIVELMRKAFGAAVAVEVNLIEPAPMV